MTAMSRTKGNAGEREIAGVLRDLLGFDIQRRVRQHDGDSDLLGVPGWRIEVKRHAKATRADIKAWWWQAVIQCDDSSDAPVLFYRLDRDSWRAVWSISEFLSVDPWDHYQWTVEGSPEAWAAVVREGVKYERFIAAKAVSPHTDAP